MSAAMWGCGVCEQGNMAGGWVAAAIAIVVWGVTFASTRVLLEDFSALEIQVIRFALAWFVLWLAGRCAKSSFCLWRDECCR